MRDIFRKKLSVKGEVMFYVEPSALNHNLT